MSARRALFWAHALVGAPAAFALLSMSLSGAALAVRPMALRLAEPQALAAWPQPGARRLPLAALAERAAPDAPFGDALTGVSLRGALDAPVVLTFGRDDAVIVDPYTGAVVGRGARRLRRFFASVEDWHRRLALEGERRPLGTAVSAASALALLFLALTGAVLWLPRRWIFRAVSARCAPRTRLRGRGLHWNWHHAAGFWGAPFLLATALTGVVMSQPKAVERLLRAPARASRGERRAPELAKAEEAPFSFDVLLAAAARKAPDWTSLELRAPRGGRPAAAFVTRAGEPAYQRSVLTLGPETGPGGRWQPYGRQPPARRLAAWAKAVHTGEAGGVPGALAALLSAAAIAILALTGLSLFIPRLRERRAARLKARGQRGRQRMTAMRPRVEPLSVFTKKT